MSLRRLTTAIAVIIYLNALANAAMYTIDNPAEKIMNPADTMYNPATRLNNPASIINNPVTRKENQRPLSPPSQAVPKPAVTPQPAKQIRQLPQLMPITPQRSYYFKTVGSYINAAKKAFIKDDYLEFISISEDALRRISAGTLKSSKKVKQKLIKYRVLGYGLLEKKVN